MPEAGQTAETPGSDKEASSLMPLAGVLSILFGLYLLIIVLAYGSTYSVASNALTLLHSLLLIGSGYYLVIRKYLGAQLSLATQLFFVLKDLYSFALTDSGSQLFYAVMGIIIGVLVFKDWKSVPRPSLPLRPYSQSPTP